MSRKEIRKLYKAIRRLDKNFTSFCRKMQRLLSGEKAFYICGRDDRKKIEHLRQEIANKNGLSKIYLTKKNQDKER